jgi:hypothetical protein
MRYLKEAVCFWNYEPSAADNADRENRIIRGKNCLSATLPNTNPTQNDLGLKTSPHGEWTVHNLLVVYASFVVFSGSDKKELG